MCAHHAWQVESASDSHRIHRQNRFTAALRIELDRTATRSLVVPSHEPHDKAKGTAAEREVTNAWKWRTFMKYQAEMLPTRSRLTSLPLRLMTSERVITEKNVKSLVPRPTPQCRDHLHDGGVHHTDKGQMGSAPFFFVKILQQWSVRSRHCRVRENHLRCDTHTHDTKHTGQ